MNKKLLWKLILILVILCIIGFMLVSVGLSELVWVFFGIYLVVIVGLVIKFFLEFVVLLIVVVVLMVVVGNLFDGVFKIIVVLSGYFLGIIWLVFSVFILSVVFVIIGLGKCIVYLLIGKIGNIMLGLGYVMVFFDLVLVSVILFNIVCVGGIVLLIINSVVVVLGFELEKSLCCVGYYLMMFIYMVIKIISYMFFIVMVGNILVLKMINDILYL